MKLDRCGFRPGGRAVRATVLAAAVAATAAGCSPDGPPDGTRAASERPESTLTILVPGNDYILGPAADDWPKFLMFEPLVYGWGALAEPGLAESWEHSDDFRTWTFHLRSDVRWHDGTPVTAHDVAFSLDLMRSPDIALHGGVLGIDAIAVPDDRTLRLSFDPPQGALGAVMGWPVYYPEHLLEDLDAEGFFDWEFWKRPVGNGPYRFVRIVPNTMVELEANPDYYAGRPGIDRIVLRLSTANPVLELTSGNADVAYYLRSSEIAALRSDDRFRIYVTWIHTEPQAIHWNQRNPFLADAAVRRALAHAVDRRELARLLYLPDEMPLVGGLSPSDRTEELYARGWDQGPAFDLDRAVALLEQAGWSDRDGDGVRERDGVEARFTMLGNQGGILSTLEPAILVQDQLAAAGVAMEIRPVENSIWYRLYRAGDFDAVIADVRNVPADLLRREDFFGEGTKIGYRNPEIVRLLQAIDDELDLAAVDSLYTEINAILRRDMPVTFLFPYFEAFAAHRKVRGLRSPDRAHPVEAIRDIWIEDEGGDP